MSSILVVNRTKANAEALASAFNEQELQLRIVPANASEARVLARRISPDVALLELDVAVGIKLVRDLLRAHPGLNVIVYGSTDDERELVAWADAGARHIVMRTVPLTELVRSVHEATHRSNLNETCAIVHRAVGLTRLVREGSTRVAGLTHRERDVLQLIAVGMSNREVAETLSLELPTVKNHVQHLMRKLGIHRRADAVRYWHDTRADSGGDA